MIRFTDAQIEALRELVTPLAPFQRGRFLQPVAECLTGITIGDGSVHQAAIEARKQVLSSIGR